MPYRPHRPHWLTFLAVLCAASTALPFGAPRAKPDPANPPALEAGWKEFPVGTNGNITVLVRVRKEASIAQPRWLEVIVQNNGEPIAGQDCRVDFRGAQITKS